MKKLAPLLVLLILASTVFGPSRSRYNPLDWLNLEKKANGLLISPEDSIATEYDWLKSSNRDGAMGALSATNRRTLVLAPGVYNIAAVQFDIDTDYVDIVALAPAMGGTRISSDLEWTGAVNTAAVSTTALRPPPTVITGSLASTTVTLGSLVKQSASNVRLHGFGIINTHDPGSTDLDTNTEDDIYASAFTMTAADNSASSYSMMYFWMTGPGVWHQDAPDRNMWSRMSVYSTEDFKGLWRDCIANGFAYRCVTAKDFAAEMYDCIGGAFSYCGDDAPVEMKNCTLYRCGGVGSFNTAYEDAGDTVSVRSGYGCFGGCRTSAGRIDATAYFYDCYAGDSSFAMGRECAGNFYRCRGGKNCFGGWRGTGTTYGYFTGYAEDCVATARSFGGSGNATNKSTGEMVRCRVTSMVGSIYVNSATFRNCILDTTGAANAPIGLSDDGTKIYGCTIRSGTANTVYAGAARDCRIAGCLLDKALHGNITNLIGTPYNVVDADVD